MNGYFLTTIKNTWGWVVYDNDRSLNHLEFYKGQFFSEQKLPLYYTIPQKSNLKKIKSAMILQSAGPELINKRLKDVIEAYTTGVQFFDVELFCEDEKIEGFYAINLPYKMECIDLDVSEFRHTNFDRANPEYMFYYMKIKENIFETQNIDMVRCKEMEAYIVVSEKIKRALFNAKLKGLQFSDSIDITPKARTVYEKI